MTNLDQCEGCGDVFPTEDLTEYEPAGLLFCQACKEENEEGEE